MYAFSNYIGMKFSFARSDILLSYIFPYVNQNDLFRQISLILWLISDLQKQHMS